MTKWKPVPGFVGLYEISDDGQIVRIATHGKKPKAIRRPVQPHTKPEGYLAVDLQRDQVRTRTYVHRLLWEAFRGPIPSGLEINHRDGNRSNNRLDNLELVTRWAEIAGAQIATHCEPLKMQWPRPVRSEAHV